MEFKANSNIDRILAATRSQARVRSPQTGRNAISFARVEALNEALRMTPRVRPEHVARARQSIRQAQYPPDEIIQGIATLLAMNLDDLAPE